MKVQPKFYCPDSLNLEERLRGKNDYWIKHIWKLYYILTVVYNSGWRRGRKPHEYMPLKTEYLRKIIGKRHTLPALDILLTLGILETDNQYLVGIKSKGYRYCKDFWDVPFHEVKSLRFPETNQLLWTPPIHLKDNPVHSFLFDNLRRVSLDEGVSDAYNNFTFKTAFQKDIYYRKIESIQKQVWHFGYDKKTGRVFNNVVNLPKVFRKYLRLEGKNLTEVDVANSQPFLLLPFYGAERETTEAIEFTEVVSAGKFYETLNAELDKPFKTRELLKKRSLTLFFDRPRPKPSRLKAVFSKRFPILSDILTERKKEKDGHKKLAIALQGLEAQIMIDGVITRIAQKFPALTIHDSLLCFPEHAPEAKQIIEDEFKKTIGVAPLVRIK